MAVFMITLHSLPQISSLADAATPQNPMEMAIQKHYQNNYIKVGDLSWLVEDKEALTPQAVSIKLGNGDINASNLLGTHLITSFNSYWGFHNNDVWGWLQARGF